MIRYTYLLIETKNIKNIIIFGIVGAISSMIRFPFLFIFLSTVSFLFLRKDLYYYNVLIVITAFLVGISPWLLRNYTVTDKFPVFLNPKVTIFERFSRGLKPETIYRITNPEKYLEYGGNRGIIKDSVEDASLRAKGVLVNTLKLMLLRFYELYKPFPGSGSNISVYVKIIIGLYNIPLMLFGFVGIFDYHQKNKINVMLYFTIPIFVLTFIHCISNAPHSRYSLSRWFLFY